MRMLQKFDLTRPTWSRIFDRKRPLCNCPETICGFEKRGMDFQSVRKRTDGLEVHPTANCGIDFRTIPEVRKTNMAPEKNDRR